jgi:hypothetical protein
MAGAHDYVRYMQHADDPFTARVMAIKNDDTSNLEDNPENWPAEKVKAAGEMFQREDTIRQNQLQSGLNADAFLAAHPEILDTKANGELFRHELNRMFGEGSLLTVNEYEAAYASLRASNFLALNKAEVARQQKAADKARYDAQRAQHLNNPAVKQLHELSPEKQRELDEMSLEEIRRLDTLENQKRMERIGNEGGW